MGGTVITGNEVVHYIVVWLPEVWVRFGPDVMVTQHICLSVSMLHASAALELLDVPMWH